MVDGQKRKQTWRFKRFPQGILLPYRIRIFVHGILVALIGALLADVILSEGKVILSGKIHLRLCPPHEKQILDLLKLNFALELIRSAICFH